MGGIVAPYVFLPKDSPKYVPGYSTSLAFIALSAVSCIAYFFAVTSQNRSRERRPTDLGLTEHEKTELGDMSPDYRYQI